MIVAALVACNPLLVWYSQEARAYALLVLGVILSFDQQVFTDYIFPTAFAMAHPTNTRDPRARTAPARNSVPCRQNPVFITHARAERAGMPRWRAAAM